MENIFTLSELSKNGAFISLIDGYHVDDNYEVDCEHHNGMPETLMCYNFIDLSLKPIYLKSDTEIKQLSTSQSHLGIYSLIDLFGREHIIKLESNIPYIFSEQSKSIGQHFKFFINYSDGETSYNAPSVIYIENETDNLNLQILKKISTDLDLRLEEEGLYSTTPNYFGVNVEGIEKINLTQFNLFQSMFHNHSY